MTRKDYVLIAAALQRAQAASHYRETQEAMLEMHAACVHGVADALALDNPRFDTERFLKACGVAS